MLTLVNRVALITGSTSGIGKGMAEHFAALGAQVVVHGRDKQAGARLIETIRSRGGDAVFLEGDIADASFYKDEVLDSRLAAMLEGIDVRRARA